MNEWIQRMKGLIQRKKTLELYNKICHGYILFFLNDQEIERKIDRKEKI